MKLFLPTRNLFLVTFLAPLALTACASVQRHPLPVQVANGPVGAVSSVRVYERGNKLFVAGSARPALSSGGSHVDVQLISADGRVVAGETEMIKLGHPRGSRSRHGDSFVASFPLTDAGRASRVRVTFHSSGH